jgi:KUP system potassium uptake protein
LHNLKHNGVLHEHNVIVGVNTTDAPRVSEAERAVFEPLTGDFVRITLNFGFMERPDVPAALGAMNCGITFDAMSTSYFVGRRTVVASHDQGLRRLQDLLFIALSRNSADPSEVFAIPPGRVVEMGVQVTV